MKKYNTLLVCILLLILISSNVWSQTTKKSLVVAGKITSQGPALEKSADSLFALAMYDAALAKYDYASKEYKKVNAWDHSIRCNVRISESLSRVGKFEEAATEINDAFILTNNHSLRGTESEAIVLNQRGFLFLNKGRNDLAIEDFKVAMEVLQKAKKVNKKELALCYNNYGLASWNAGNNELATEHLQKSLSLRQEEFGVESIEVASAYNNLGLVYLQNNPDKAMQYYLQALGVYEKVNGANHPNTAIAYNNIAIAQRKQKKFDEALVNFQKVLTIWGAMNKARHPNAAFVYTNVGQVYYDKGMYDKALEMQKTALDIYKENYGDKHPEIASTYNQIGNIYSIQFKYSLALENYQNALCANVMNFSSKDSEANPTIDNYYNGGLLLFSLLQKARTLETKYTSKTLKVADLKLALSTFYSCDTLIERIRKIQTNKNDKIELGKLAASIYEDAIRVCMLLKEVSVAKKQYDEKAFYFAEKNKTAVLLEAISDAEAKHFANIPDSLLEKEKYIKSEISFYEQKIAERTIASKEQEYKDKLFSLNREYEKLIAYMEKSFPEYFNLKYNVKAVTVASVQSLLPKETALVSYFIADESKRVYIFYVSKNKFEVYDVAEINELNKVLIGFRNAIKFDVKEEYSRIGYELYKQLMPFAISKSVTKLVIVPDGKLGTIPFEAFLSKKVSPERTEYSNYPYLINKVSISYSYSVSLFQQALQKKSTTEGNLFTCAPVNFSSYNSSSLNDLPATKEEVTSIQELFQAKGYVCKSYLGNAVQESLMKSNEFSTYKYVHFATHGIVDELKPELSQIYLSPDSSKVEDGNLFSGEIYNLKIKADLVTLSACQTGLGKVQKGEGIIGLSRALLYAGAQNLIVSLWSVADKSTSLLMVDFYKGLLASSQESDYTNSLRKAKLAMIQQKEYSRPYYWAPFILIGK